MKQKTIRSNMKYSLLKLVTILTPLPLGGVGGGLLASCADDDAPNYGSSFQTPAQQDAQGTYQDTFIRVQVGTTDSLVATGTLTITATDTLNRARITYTSGDMEELAKTTPIAANITHADQGFMFYNKSGDNALLGRITDSNGMTVTFTKAVRSGRKTVRYNYSFDGRKL